MVKNHISAHLSIAGRLAHAVNYDHSKFIFVVCCLPCIEELVENTQLNLDHYPYFFPSQILLYVGHQSK